MARPEYPKTALDFQRRFSTDEACAEYLIRCRWPDGYSCPRCGNAEYYLHRPRGLIECKACRYQCSLTAGTVLHGTRQPLSTWFYAAQRVATQKPGMSAKEFQRQAGIDYYETAFNMLHRLRAGMVRPDRDKIHGLVEVDETYIGGPHEGKGGRGAAGKAIVIGAVEVLTPEQRAAQQRVPRLRLRVIPNVKAVTLLRFISDWVVMGSTILTDDFPSYGPLSRSGYRHRVMDNEAGLIHIHTVFGNLKAWLEGTHHGVSAKHLQAYCNEFVFRFNRRRTPMAAFQTLLGIGSHRTGPTYEGLYKGTWIHPNPKRLRSLYG